MCCSLVSSPLCPSDPQFMGKNRTFVAEGCLCSYPPCYYYRAIHDVSAMQWVAAPLAVCYKPLWLQAPVATSPCGYKPLWSIQADRLFIIFITSEPTRKFMHAFISRPMLDIKTPFTASSYSHTSCHLILSFVSWKQIRILLRLRSLVICTRAQPAPAHLCLALHTTRYTSLSI